MPTDPASYDLSTCRIELDEVDSTNLEALRRALVGERGPVWIVTDRQTAGRGRLGRDWRTLAGNLAATLLMAPRCAPGVLHQLSLVAGIAAYDSVAAILGRTEPGALRLKWPNDLLLHGAKLGGVLVESSTTGSEIVAAIGIGINVASAPKFEDRATVCLADRGRHLSARDLLDGLDAEMKRWLACWAQGSDFAAIRAAWLERAGPLGESISVSAGSEIIAGAFAGIDETGALLVSSVAKPGEVRRFTFGDVSLQPAQTGGAS